MDECCCHEDTSSEMLASKEDGFRHLDPADLLGYHGEASSCTHRLSEGLFCLRGFRWWIDGELPKMEAAKTMTRISVSNEYIQTNQLV